MVQREGDQGAGEDRRAQPKLVQVLRGHFAAMLLGEQGVERDARRVGEGLEEEPAPRQRPERTVRETFLSRGCWAPLTSFMYLLSAIFITKRRSSAMAVTSDSPVQAYDPPSCSAYNNNVAPQPVSKPAWSMGAWTYQPSRWHCFLALADSHRLIETSPSDTLLRRNHP